MACARAGGAKSARELGMAVRAGEGRQASLQQFLECAQTVLAELEPNEKRLVTRRKNG